VWCCFMILCLAVLVEHRLVTDGHRHRRTQAHIRDGSSARGEKARYESGSQYRLDVEVNLVLLYSHDFPTSAATPFSVHSVRK